MLERAAIYNKKKPINVHVKINLTIVTRFYFNSQLKQISSALPPAPFFHLVKYKHK